MYLKRFTCMVVTLVMVIGMLCLPVSAVEIETSTYESATENIVALPRATESFSISIPAKTALSASTSFPLAAGETVTIKASYIPFSASVDFGLVAPNGVYYYFTITDGNLDKTIEVPENGEYTLKIRNNEDFAVDVVGFVNY